MMKNSRKKWLPILLMLPILILAGASYFKTKGNRLPPEISGIYLPEPQYINPFQLDTSTGASFTDQDLKGQWTLMFFGFTFCPDVCPTTLAMLDGVTKKIAADYPHVQAPQVVFVSVDPERDSLEHINRYVHYFNEDFIGVTGSPVQLSKLARQVGIVYEKVFTNRSDAESYLMEHSTSIIMINPRGGIQAIFTSPHDPFTLPQDIVAVYNNGR
jgi:protein SCO1/2